MSWNIRVYAEVQNEHGDWEYLGPCGCNFRDFIPDTNMWNKIDKKEISPGLWKELGLTGTQNDIFDGHVCFRDELQLYASNGIEQFNTIQMMIWLALGLRERNQYELNSDEPDELTHPVSKKMFDRYRTYQRFATQGAAIIGMMNAIDARVENPSKVRFIFVNV